MNKKVANLILSLPFILAIFLFVVRSTIQDIVNGDGSIIEQGFGYSVMGVILFMLGILLVCIRIIRKRKSFR